MTAIETLVKRHRGAPTLVVDGRPVTGLTFFFGRVEDGAEDIRAFARAGIDLFSGGFGLGDCCREEGRYDFSSVDERFDYVLDANPRALILPRVRVVARPLPAHWGADELQVDVDLATGERRRGGPSFSSTLWHCEGGKALQAYVRHCEDRYGDHVLGYHVAAGAAGEWSYSWQAVLSDYSPAQGAAFRRWLRVRYGGDIDALRTAWGQGGLDFETAAMPAPERRVRQGDEPSLFDPREDRDVIDYLTFHSEAVARALVHFCGAAKATLRELGRRKVVGAFYGYEFKNLNRPSNFHNTGHFAQGIVLDSPDVDFICAPYCYQGREHGGMYLAQLLAGSVRLRDKLYWCEDDTFTFLSRPEHGRSWCPDRASTIGVLRRNLAGILRDGGTAWWMDCGGNGPARPGGQVHGWYRDEGLMENFARMERFARARLAAGDRPPSAPIAVFLSDESTVYQRHDAALMDSLIMRQMFEVAAVGASFDTYRVADLGRLFSRPWSDAYRLLIFLDALYLSDEERRVLRERVQSGGRTILWNYGAGLVTDDGFSPEAMADATGIRVALHPRAEPLIVSAFLAGTRVLYGTERPIGPVIHGADADAQVHGHLLNLAAPGLLEKSFDGWRSIWSAAPAVPAALLRAIARQAGIHLYVDTGEQVIAEQGYLTLHAGFTGERVVRLPGPSDVVDAWTGETVGENVSEFRAAIERGSTATWMVTQR